MTEEIEVSDKTAKRFESMKAELTTAHTPELEAGEFLNALLDTHEAVVDGFYRRETAAQIAEYIDASTVAQGVDTYAVEIVGFSVSEWADMTGRSNSAVRMNINRWYKQHD